MSVDFRILFVCTGNTCRSPMAEGALRVLLKAEKYEDVTVASCGTSAALGFPATIYAIEAAKMWDADLSGHQSRPLSRSMVEEADLVFGMSPEHVREILRKAPKGKDKVFLFKNFPDPETGGAAVDDPIGQSLERYNETFLEIGEYLGKNLPEIVKRIDAKRNLEK